MAKCNLLRSLQSGGTFYLFSQYAEDLTMESTQKDTWRVTPSTFAAVNLTVPSNADNKSIGEIFQNQFENACALYREQNDESPDIHDVTTALFWKTLIDNGFITATSGVYESVVYKGDINIITNNNVGGDEYNNLYCYIPNGAGKYKYQSISTGSYVYGGEIADPLCGFEDGSYPSSNSDLSGTSKKFSDGTLDVKNILIPSISSTGTLDSADSYTFNCIIVFYNITNGDDVVFENIPMGIYFTGEVKNQTITNAVTKVCSSDELFGQGTSYGLRICYRFMAVPNSNLTGTLETETYQDEQADKYYELLSAMADNLELMLNISNDQRIFTKNIKEAWENFANYKANVPYIQDGYWYVNGKQMVRATADDNIFINDTSTAFTIHSKESDQNVVVYDATADTTTLAGTMKAKKVQISGDINCTNNISAKSLIVNGTNILNSLAGNNTTINTAALLVGDKLIEDGSFEDLSDDYITFTDIKLSEYGGGVSTNMSILLPDNSNITVIFNNGGYSPLLITYNLVRTVSTENTKEYDTVFTAINCCELYTCGQLSNYQAIANNSVSLKLMLAVKGYNNTCISLNQYLSSYYSKTKDKEPWTTLTAGDSSQVGNNDLYKKGSLDSYFPGLQGGTYPDSQYLLYPTMLISRNMSGVLEQKWLTDLC